MDYGAVMLRTLDYRTMGTNDLAYHQSELARAMFKARVRRRDKSPPERAADLERLVRLAYPRAQSDLQDTLAKDQFKDALLDDESHIRIRHGRPESIQGALRLALEMESYHLANRWRHLHTRGTVRQVYTVGQIVRESRSCFF